MDTTNFAIKPCTLVSVSISVDRAVRYTREYINATRNEDGSEDTEALVQAHYKSPEETRMAQALYNYARNRIHTACIRSPIGYVCAPENLNRLSEIIKEVREHIERHNTQIFKHCRVTPHIVLTSLAPDNDAAKELVLATIREAMSDIKDALTDLDVTKIRNLLQSTKNMADVISDPNARDTVMAFQKEAKELCSDISKALKEADNNVQIASIALEDKSDMKKRISKYVF